MPLAGKKGSLFFTCTRPDDIDDEVCLPGYPHSPTKPRLSEISAARAVVLFQNGLEINCSNCLLVDSHIPACTQ